MIDGLPAFPGESVPEAFREARLGLAGQMVTVVSEPFGYRLVTWAGISPEFHEAVGRLADALSSAGGGRVERR